MPSSNRRPPPRTFLAEGTTFHLRHVDNPSRGLRFVGFADALAPRAVRNKGWYVDEDGETLFRGVVYQLPARGGHPRFIAGYADPTDPDNSTFLDFTDVYDAAIEAAIDADTIAQFCAEGERAWNEANLARMDYSECEGWKVSKRPSAITRGGGQGGPKSPQQQEEQQQMRHQTLIALQASIEHWRANTIAPTPEDASTSRFTCALCEAFFTNNACVGCPVREKTKEARCQFTPYRAASAALEIWCEKEPSSPEWNEARAAFHAAAWNELDFLLSLLPPSAPPSEVRGE